MNHDLKRVYFIRPIGMAGPIKIGCSVLPEGRLKAIDIWSPFPLELMATAPGGHAEERRLHWRFRKDRSHGEWFSASCDLLNLIDHVRLNGALPPLEAPQRGTRKLRNIAWRTQKTALGKWLHQAERWAWGFHGREGMRPANIEALRSKCEGAHQPPLSGADLAEMEDYIARLMALPCGKGVGRDKELRDALEAKWAARREALKAAA